MGTLHKNHVGNRVVWQKNGIQDESMRVLGGNNREFWAGTTESSSLPKTFNFTSLKLSYTFGLYKRISPELSQTSHSLNCTSSKSPRGSQAYIFKPLKCQCSLSQSSGTLTFPPKLSVDQTELPHLFTCIFKGLFQDFLREKLRLSRTVVCGKMFKGG